MHGHLISQAAERTGFTPSTLRYYERIGLLPPPERTGTGYRIYRDRHLERLQFIARAKRLGLTLEEIADLARAWGTHGCAANMARLDAAVTAKLDLVEAEIASLGALRDQLRDARRHLRQAAPEAGPCGPGCGCTSALAHAPG